MPHHEAGLALPVCVLCQKLFERAHDKLVILLLGKARNGNRANNSDVANDEGERAAVRGIVT